MIVALIANYFCTVGLFFGFNFVFTCFLKFFKKKIRFSELDFVDDNFSGSIHEDSNLAWHDFHGSLRFEHNPVKWEALNSLQKVLKTLLSNVISNYSRFISHYNVRTFMTFKLLNLNNFMLSINMKHCRYVTISCKRSNSYEL